MRQQEIEQITKNIAGALYASSEMLERTKDSGKTCARAWAEGSWHAAAAILRDMPAEIRCQFIEKYWDKDEKAPWEML